MAAATLSQDAMASQTMLLESSVRDSSPMSLPSSSATTESAPQKELTHQCTATADDAAAELWDLIHASPPPEPLPRGGRGYRYARSQANRTLLHPKLVQPTADDEERHLEKLRHRRSFSEDSVSMESWESSSSVVFPADRCSDCSSVDHSSDADQDADTELRARLSEALLLGSQQQRNRSALGKLAAADQDIIRRDENGYLDEGFYEEDGNGPSPTSTLNFPDPTQTVHALSHKLRPEKHLVAEAEEKKADDGEADDVDRAAAGSQSAPLCHRAVTEIDRHSPKHTFVVCADSQVGMTSKNEEWETELNYCRRAICRINAIHPRPKFVCVCGDLVDMEWTFVHKSGKDDEDPSAPFTREECDDIQDKQNRDFKEVWEQLHPDIGLVCICGNHDIGNRPTAASIQKFRSAFGDEYLAFWCNGTYNIVLNNVLFSNPDGARDMFEEQLAWLEGRLTYARRHDPAQIFVFAHHPWFLYHEEEDADELVGVSAAPPEWNPPPGAKGFPDSYFSIAKKYRKLALDLFREYGVDAAFVGHFHQNLLSRTEWGMQHIITAPLSMVFDSTGKPDQPEENGRGFRTVEVTVDVEGGSASGFTHQFELI